MRFADRRGSVMACDDQELRAITFLAQRVRRATLGAGPWDESGIMANLRKISNRSLPFVIEQTIRHAADPKAKSPGVIAASFSPPPVADDRTPTPPKRDQACQLCGQWLSRCICGERQTRPPRVGDAASGAAKARAALRGTSEEEA